MKQYDLPRITYTKQPADLEPFHIMLDAELPKFRNNLGKRWPNWIAGAENWDGDIYDASSPLDRELILGSFVEANKTAVDKAVDAATQRIPLWGKQPWTKRVEVIRSIAKEMTRKKYELSMAVLYEVGKARMQAISEVEEAIDFLYYYSEQLEINSGYQGSKMEANKGEVAQNCLLPFGVFGVLSPFNYPVALSVGMMTAALLGGNSVVWKPSPFSGVSASLLVEVFEEGGLPTGVMNVVFGESAGPLLVDHPGIDGFAFTGSYEVGTKILRAVANGQFMRPVLAEMGGKNHAYVSKSAEVKIAIDGVVASAFGMEGQKCTACSVAYIHEDVYQEFIDGAVAKVESLRAKIGNVEKREFVHGPVINADTYERYVNAAEYGKSTGCRILTGGQRITTTETERGYYVEHMMIDQLPDDSYLLTEEQFGPVLAIAPFSSLEDAMQRGNASQYGLTCGFYGTDEAEINYFRDNAQAGVLYINRRTGATTGAWPGIQSFCGWKGSGLTGKGGLGPHYVVQFMREQNQTIRTL